MNALSWVSRKSRFIVLYGIVAVLIFSGFKLLQDRSWFMGLFFFISSFLIVYIYAISKNSRQIFATGRFTLNSISDLSIVLVWSRCIYKRFKWTSTK